MSQKIILIPYNPNTKRMKERDKAFDFIHQVTEKSQHTAKKSSIFVRV